MLYRHRDSYRARGPRGRDSRGGRSLGIDLLVLAAALCVLSALVYHASAAALRYSSFRFSRIADGTIHVNVLVAGNSRARDLLTGSEPSIASGRGTGSQSGSGGAASEGRAPPTVFNLAYNGLSREDTFAWIETYFRQGNTAATILIETSALFDNQQYCDSKPYWVIYPELFTAQRVGCVADARIGRYFPLTLFDSEQYLRALYYLAAHPHGDQDWVDEYYIPPRLCTHLPLDSIYHFRAHALALNVTLARAEISDFESWLALHGYHTHVMFALSPFFSVADSRAAIADMDRVDAKLLDGQDSVSLSTALGGDCSAFADSEHLGSKGRVQVRAMIFQYLGYR